MSTNRIGIDCLSVFGLPPVQFVGIASDLGCRYISIGLDPVGPNLSRSPTWTLRSQHLRREMIAALDDKGVSISLGEGLAIFPGKDVADYAADLDAMAELGVPRIGTVSVDPDRQRTLDQLGKFADMAAKIGIVTMIEFVPTFTIGSLADAVAAVRQLGRGKLGILVDCMHLIRSGASAADLAALDPAMFGYLQLCDVPLAAAYPDYIHEAMYERRAPGEGELPVLDIVAALPPELVIGLEVPMAARLAAGEDARTRLAGCVSAARALVSELEMRS